MKRLCALLLVLVFMCAFAQADEDKLTEDRRELYRAAVSAVFQMQANALNTEWDNNEQRMFAQGFAAFDAAYPSAAAVFELNDAQVNALCSVYGCEVKGLLPALNNSINSGFSRGYTSVMDRLGLAQTDNLDGIGTYTCILLVYRSDLVLVLAAPGRMLYTTAFISTEEINSSFDKVYAVGALASAGLRNVNVTVLDAEDLEDLKESASYYRFDPSDRVVKAVAASEKSMKLLLPYIAKSGFCDSDVMAINLIEGWLNGHKASETEALAASAFIRNVIAPLLDINGVTDWEDISSMTSFAVDAGSLPAFREQALPVKKGDKVLAVYHNEDKDTYSINTYLTAVLPGVQVPASVEEADKILLVSTHWESTGINNGIELFKAVSVVTLNDGKTGECIMTLGRLEDRMTGFRMVSGKEYREPVHWDRVSELFREVVRAD